MIKILLFLYLLLKIVFNLDIYYFIPSISNCISTFVVQTEFNGEEKDIYICSECDYNYVVSKNQRACLQMINQIGQQGYLNCQRIDYTGSCAEAFIGIDLIGKDEFSFITKQIFADRCAKIDSSYITCNYPRFGYVLDFQKQILWVDTEKTFCAIFDSGLNKCIEYFLGFIYDEETGNTLYLGDQFINPQQVKQNGKGFRNIECKENYEFIQKKDQKIDIFDQKYEIIILIGCFQKGNNLTQQDKGIENCLEYIYEKRICKQCVEGYSLSPDKQKCKIITLNCVEYEIYFGEEICSKCKPFYKKEYRECTLIANCIQISEMDQNLCTGCQVGFELIKYRNDCDQTKNKLSPDCMVSGEGKIQNIQCIKCQLNEQFYLTFQRCELRNKSMNCKQQSNDSDNCLSQECIDGYQFRYVQNYFMSEINHKEPDTFKQFEQMMIKYNIDLSQLLYNKDYYRCVKIQNYNIEGCEKYNPVQQNCLYCKKGYQKVEVERITDYSITPQYKCVQVQQPIPKKIIEHCIQYDEFYQECQKCKQFYFYDQEIGKCFQVDNCLIPFYNNIKQFFRLNSCILCRLGFQINGQTNQCESVHGIIYGKTINYKTIYFKDEKEGSEFRQEPCKKEFDGKCLLCYNGYILDKRTYKCIRDIYFPNCQVIDEIQQSENSNSNENKSNEKNSQNEIKCLICNAGYILDRGMCICQQTNCLRTYLCQSPEGCFKKLRKGFQQYGNILQNILKLSNQYYIFNEDLVIDKCELSNCEICKRGGCYLCNKEYFYNKKLSKCVQRCNSDSCIDPSTINNPYQSYPCQDYIISQKNICKKCQSESQYIMSDGFCQDYCPINYIQTIYRDKTKICYKCPQNCLECTFNEKQFFENGQIKCFACSPGMTLIQSNCYQECPFYQDESQNCLEECPKNEFIQEKKCLKKCPKYYAIFGNQQRKTCIDKCTQNNSLQYPDQPFYCAQQCDTGYIIDIQNRRCLKCEDRNCKECQLQDQSKCAQCLGDYFLTDEKKCRYKCSNGEIVTQQNECELKCQLSYCLKCSENNRFCEKCLYGFSLTSDFNCICESGKFINELSGKCDFCHPKCINCLEKEGCIECNKESYLIPISSQNNKSNNILYTCTQNCPIGTYPAPSFSSTEFSKLHAACLKCPQIGCTSCKSPTECLDCSGKFHLKHDSTKNQFYCECKPGYFLFENDCKFKCQNLKMVEHENDCCNVENCDSCIRSTDTCDRCNSLFPLLVSNKCLRNCPDGTFENNEKQCEQCNELCLSCEKQSTTCTSCRLPKDVSSIKNNCQCNFGLNYFQGQCVPECPLYSHVKRNSQESLNIKVCEFYCTNELEFPIFNEKSEFVSCENIHNTSDSIFCEQHISNLLNLIKFDLITENDSSKDNQIKLKIIFSSTPHNCYNYQLRGKQNFYVANQKYETQATLNTFFLTYYINKQDFSNQESIVCNLDFCFLNFEIYLNKSLRLTYKIKLNASLNIIAVEGIKDSQVISNSASSIISISSLDKKQIQPSFQNIECPPSSLCNNRNITTNINKPISITLTAIQQNPLSQSILEIHSIYLIKEDNQIEPIKIFYFENFFSNILKIIITFDQEMSGQLVVISKSKQRIPDNQQNGAEINDKTLNPSYLTSQIDLNIKKYFKISDDENNKNEQQTVQQQPAELLIIFIIFNTIICFMIFVYSLYKIYRFCQQKIIRKGFKNMIEERNDSVTIELR